MLQRKNREINIFNLSMMDVISGAMGAFLIIVILLSRYYDSDIDGREEIVKIEAELRQALDRLQEADRQLQLKQGDVEDVIQKIRSAKYNLDSIQGGMDEVQRKLDQAKSHVNRLEEEKKELEQKNRALDARRPFILRSEWTCANGNIDIYLRDDSKSNDGHPMPPFNPHEQQWSYWTGDLYVDAGGTGQGTETWMTLAVYPGITYRLYYKLDGGKESAQGCSVFSNIFSRYFDTIEIPSVALSKETPWLYAGSFVIDEDRKVGKFQPASSAEQEEAKQNMEKDLKDFEPIQKERERRRMEQKLADPNADRKEESQSKKATPQRDSFWSWWK